MGQDNGAPLGTLRRDDPGTRRPVILVLFDLDGTLSAIGTFSPYLSKASKEIIGVELPHHEKLNPNNRSAAHVVREMVVNAGVEPDRVDKVVGQIEQLAKKYYAEALRDHPIKTYDGVVQLVQGLDARADVAIGLVTNNDGDLVRMKLASAGLLDTFNTRGIIVHDYDDTRDKSRHINEAIALAEKKFGVSFDRRRIFYIGDQASDAAAAKLAGINMVGVATGKGTPEELTRAGADVVFQSLADVAAVLSFIDSRAARQRSRT